MADVIELNPAFLAHMAQVHQARRRRGALWDATQSTRWIWLRGRLLLRHPFTWDEWRMLLCEFMDVEVGE